MKRKGETWEAWAERNSTNREAMKAYRAAQRAHGEWSQLDPSPDEYCFRHLIDCPHCGMTHMESYKVPFLRCKCGFRTRISELKVGAPGSDFLFKIVDTAAEYDWQYEGER
jgi:hypothetical protein